MYSNDYCGSEEFVSLGMATKRCSKKTGKEKKYLRPSQSPAERKIIDRRIEWYKIVNQKIESGFLKQDSLFCSIPEDFIVYRKRKIMGRLILQDKKNVGRFMVEPQD